MSSVLRSSYSSRTSRTAGGVTRTEEKSVRERIAERGGSRRDDKKVTVEKDGVKVSEDKTSREQKTPGIGKTRPLKDLNDNEVKSEEKSVGSKKMEPKKETKGAEAVVDLKAEAAKRRQRTQMNIEQRMVEQRQRKAADAKKRTQGRQAFKAQLESNAPARNGPTKSSFKRSADSNIEKLLKWTQRLTDMYPGVKVTDFSSSWADGLAFCALLNSLCPGEFPLDKMSEDDRKTNFDLAFSFAEEKGVAPLLETSDMLRTKNPDSKSMITYLHTIYKVMIADKAEQEKKNKEESKSKTEGDENVDK